MALFIERSGGKPATWHVGDKKPFAIVVIRNDGEIPEYTAEDFQDVVEVQADGLELDHIMKNFTNVPFRLNSRVTSWKGHWAQFIYDNL